jgi:hypothetical protein
MEEGKFDFAHVCRNGNLPLAKIRHGGHGGADLEDGVEQTNLAKRN